MLYFYNNPKFTTRYKGRLTFKLICYGLNRLLFHKDNIHLLF